LRTCKTLFGSEALSGVREPGSKALSGHVDGVEFASKFYEPSGLAFFDGKLYIADTNNHAIRAADLQAKKVETLILKPQALFETIAPHVDHLVALNTPVTRLPEQAISANANELILAIGLPAGAKFNTGSPLQLLARTINGALEFDAKIIKLDEPQSEMAIPFRVLPGFTETALRLELLYYYCHTPRSLCMVRQAVFEMPLRIAADGSDRLLVTDQVREMG
jgi:hypothetical protein